ncbi:MAG: NHL repeat-containing protein [Phycisphaerae bacterium]|nr:NHL repeat-containing protein [Phycisphaerae bacterium]
MYGPRGVAIDGDTLIVADSGNHRVLIWRSMPTRDHQPADIVLGQHDLEGETPGLLHLPTGVGVYDGRLYVADAWHHRILIWNRVPDANDAPPDAVLGQADLAGVQENRGARASCDTLYWPYGLAYVGGRFYVADTGNRRVLVWHRLPRGGEPADAVIGQPDFESTDENRGGPVSASSFRWPHAVCGVARDGRDELYVADAGNHRVLMWKDVRAALAGRDADGAIGQPNLVSNREWPYGPQGPSALRFPYFVASAGDDLYVADTANNRVLLVDSRMDRAAVPAAHAVLGQHSFDDSGENRWNAVECDSLCWPYGLAIAGDTLAIADSGNNRVMLWRRTARD